VDPHLRQVLALPAGRAARALLGQRLVRRLDDRPTVVARIVETEAYLPRNDAAAHAYRGRTARTAPLFGPPGTLYVYLVYGLHYCLNIAVDREGVPGCVLIRAAEPEPGSGLGPRDLSGPGRLCRRLVLNRAFSGQDLFAPGAPLTLLAGPAPLNVLTTTRIGLQVAGEKRLRFCDAASDAVSRHPVSFRASARAGILERGTVRPRTPGTR